MAHVDLPSRRRHYYEVTIDAGGGVVYTGKGPTEAAARTKAKALARNRGGFSVSAVNGMTELDVKSLVGPKTRTFDGNSRVPND